MYDIVYPLKEQTINLDLKYALRSLEKFGAEVGKVVIVGYKPAWITNVIHIPTEQHFSKWQNTRSNWKKVCKCDDLSEDIILMNDDFIFSEPVKSWEDVTNLHMGTLMDRYNGFLDEKKEMSAWRNGHKFTHELLQSMGVDTPLNYEYHGPMIMNRRQRIELLEREDIRPLVLRDRPLLLIRSLYGNLYPRKNSKQIRDIKFLADSFDISMSTEHGFFSVDDGIIGNDARCPKLNGWLRENFPNKSKYEL
jgi:hypothetical protein